MAASKLKLRPCIVCSEPTRDRSRPHNDPRCAKYLPCALRRNAGRARPKPEQPIIDDAIARGLA